MMKSITLLFFVSFAMSLPPIPLSRGFTRSWNEGKRNFFLGKVDKSQIFWRKLLNNCKSCFFPSIEKVRKKPTLRSTDLIPVKHFLVKTEITTKNSRKKIEPTFYRIF